jgi:hypothetical protein
MIGARLGAATQPAAPIAAALCPSTNAPDAAIAITEKIWKQMIFGLNARSAPMGDDYVPIMGIRLRKDGR